jgi:hypothetical protein
MRLDALTILLNAILVLWYAIKSECRFSTLQSSHLRNTVSCSVYILIPSMTLQRAQIQLVLLPFKDKTISHFMQKGIMKKRYFSLL